MQDDGIGRVHEPSWRYVLRVVYGFRDLGREKGFLHD